jgi:hypothetical protein
MDQRPLSSRGHENRRGRALRNTLAVLLGINVSVLVFTALVVGISRLPVLPRAGGQGWNWPASLIIGGVALVAMMVGALAVRGVARFLSLAQGPPSAQVGRGWLPEDDPPGEPAGRRQLVPSRTRDHPAPR